MIARRVYFTGRVQGVGFRYSTKEIAKGFDVTGWIKNLNDGRVEMLVKGDEEEVDSFIEDITEQSHLANFVRSVDVETTSPGSLDGVRGFVIER
ncbi:MAG: acylphosphatase [Verrucomicrobiota bacterium]